MTSLSPNLDPEKIFERGFVTREEAEAVDLSSFSSKVNLCDDDDYREGIWVAFITQEDRDRYDDNGSSGEEIRGILLNHAICLFPNPTWGRVIVGRTNGATRPVFKRADQVKYFQNTHDAYLKEYP